MSETISKQADNQLYHNGNGLVAPLPTGVLVLVSQRCAVKQRCTAGSATELGNSMDTLGLLLKLKTPVPEDTKAGLSHRLADSMPLVIQKNSLGVYFHYIWAGLVKLSHASA